MTQNPQPEAAQAFLDQLWGRKPLSAAVQIWEKSTGLNSTFSLIRSAADHAVAAAGRGDVYMAAGLALRQTRPARTRANAGQVVGIPGVWADIDVNGGPEMKTGAAPTLDIASALAFELLEPTALVASGYGLQAWWLFEDPWIFDSAGDQREQARRLVKAFQLALRAKAKARGFSLDSTHDLARLMRLPGTLNHKGEPVPVSQLEHEGPTYEPEQLHGVAEAFMKEAATLGAELAGSDVDIHVNGNAPLPPIDRLIEVFSIDPDFQQIWLGKHKPGDGTASGRDQSIANRMVGYGFTDQEIAEAIRAVRHKLDPTDEKIGRADYLKLTISKARGGKKREQRRQEVEDERNQAIEQMGVIAEEAEVGEVDAPVIIGLFQKIYGGPQIKELVQIGADYDGGRLKLVLADGRDVPLGTIDTLLDQKKFTARFGAVTQYFPAKEIRATKDQPVGWQQLMAGFLKSALVIEETEDSRLPQLRAWLREYIERYRGNEKNYACMTSDPFIEDGELHISSPSFHDWLRKAKGLRVQKADVNALLMDGGFSSTRVNYYPNDDKTKRSKRDYWHAPVDVLDDDPQEATTDGA